MWQAKVIKIKFWVQRTMGYAAIANFGLLLYLVLDRKGMGGWTVPIAILCVIVGVVFGWLEDRVGLARAEYELNAERMGIKKEIS